ALEILRRLDRALSLHRHGKRRLVEYDIDRDRRILRLLGREFDQRIDVAEASVVSAIRDQRHGGTRAVALVERDLQTLGLVVTAVFRQKKHPLRALILPVQHQLEFGLCARRGRESERNGEHEHAEQRGTYACWTEIHWRTPVWPCCFERKGRRTPVFRSPKEERRFLPRRHEAGARGRSPRRGRNRGRRSRKHPPPGCSRSRGSLRPAAWKKRSDRC